MQTPYLSLIGSPVSRSTRIKVIGYRAGTSRDAKPTAPTLFSEFTAKKFKDYSLSIMKVGDKLRQTAMIIFSVFFNRNKTKASHGKS